MNFTFTDNLEVSKTDICVYLKILAGDKFMYQNNEEDYILYCYNGKYWQNDDTHLRYYLSTELYQNLKMTLMNYYLNSRNFSSMKTTIDKLQTYSFNTSIVRSYKEYGVNNEIKFDSNWKLLGFKNLVYDMEIESFREYRYNDYVSITTGYDWREPTEEEIKTMEKLIISIMPIEEERNRYLQVLTTILEGRSPEKIIFFNGKGGNGKGMIDDLLLLALGNYGLIGNNTLLFKISKSGSNPEKANIHKKRLVVFRQPAERNKLKNSIMKELTENTFSARSHCEKDTIKELHATIIVECNTNPFFAKDKTNMDANICRIEDIHFRNTFTRDQTIIDENNDIYEANPEYKTKEFQEKHKYALLKILMQEHSKFYKQSNPSILYLNQYFM